jgi:hypothetical protein
MVTTKGLGFINVRSFVTERYGAEAWKDLLDSFPPADRAVLGSVVSIGWYDLALYARLIRAVDERMARGNLKLVYALGRYEAERDLTGVHQWFLRLFSPATAIDQIGKYWRRFHDTGAWETERRGDREVIARLSGWGVVDAALCRELLGYLGRALELLGGRDIGLQHTRCRVDQEPLCEFQLRWRTSRESKEAGGTGELPPWMPPPTGQQGSPQR